MSYTRSHYLTERISPVSGHDENTFSTSPDPIEHPSLAKSSEYFHHDKPHAEPQPAAIRGTTSPIHHHIAPALAAPFMNAEGLVHRGRDRLVYTEELGLMSRSFGPSL